MENLVAIYLRILKPLSSLIPMHSLYAQYKDELYIRTQSFHVKSALEKAKIPRRKITIFIVKLCLSTTEYKND